MGRLAATDDPVTLQAVENPCHARLENAGQFRELIAFHFSVLPEDSDYPPLLFRQTMLIQQGAEVAHDCFAGLKQ
ncbi:hypothetical protein GCM10017624_16720 [Azotobacter vinelandii]|nr:hypothetical protein GCM10017624_16720 [Azotobacter vinelandii]